MNLDVKKLSFFANNIDIIKATAHYPITFTSYVLIHILFCMCAHSEAKTFDDMGNMGGEKKTAKKLGFWPQEALNLIRELNVSRFP